MNPDNRDDFLWLLSEEAAPILEKVKSAFEERINAVRIAKSLRKSTTATRSALVMEQAQLRIRGRRKFALADQMFFTRRGLEQSSGQDLASYKARRFAGLTAVGDICCGIGGDLLSFALRNNQSDRGSDLGKTTGVDMDELTCWFAQRNLEVHSIDSSRGNVEQVSFEDFDISSFDGLHIDPDRRMADRTVHGNRFSPSLDSVYDRVGAECSVCVKVAPATPTSDCFPTPIQREWIGDHRECKQQLLWSGPMTSQPGHRTATYIGKRGNISQISFDESESAPVAEIADSIRAYLFEPHPTVLAAHLTDVISNQYGLARFTSGIVYLTGGHPVDDPLLSQFEVIEVLPMNIRKTASLLKSLDVGVIEVKKRGIDDVAAAQYGRLKLSGPNRATVLLTRMGRNRIVIVAKRKGTEFNVPNQ